MKINEFIADVLKDINSGLQEAKNQANRRYYVDFKGVNFDIAVIVQNSTSSEVEGQAKAGFVQVLGAGMGAKLSDKKENSEVSRIQFTIYVPTKTEAEEEESTRIIQRNQMLNEGYNY